MSLSFYKTSNGGIISTSASNSVMSDIETISINQYELAIEKAEKAAKAERTKVDNVIATDRANKLESAESARSKLTALGLNQNEIDALLG